MTTTKFATFVTIIEMQILGQLKWQTNSYLQHCLRTKDQKLFRIKQIRKENQENSTNWLPRSTSLPSLLAWDLRSSTLGTVVWAPVDILLPEKPVEAPPPGPPGPLSTVWASGDNTPILWAWEESLPLLRDETVLVFLFRGIVLPAPAWAFGVYIFRSVLSDLVEPTIWIKNYWSHEWKLAWNSLESRLERKSEKPK